MRALCSKGGEPSIEQLYHPDRIDYPLIRTGKKGEMKWQRVSWDEAMQYIAKKMLAISESMAQRLSLSGVGRRSTTITSPAGWPICSAART